jgi:hypothetical protein
VADETVEIPGDLRERITGHLKDNRQMRWDEALAEIIEPEED